MIDLINIASGSRGNCTFLRSGTTSVLVDAGIPVVSIKKRLPETISDLSAVLITHEHIDHIRGLYGLVKNSSVPVYVHEKIVSAVCLQTGLSPQNLHTFGDADFSIGKINVTPFRIPHDTVYPVAFCLRDKDSASGVATDLGIVTEGVRQNLADCDTLLIESNHDVEMLKNGKYPPQLKARILGKFGHLSNENCADLVFELVNKNLKKVMLGHISENNNTPSLAYKTTEKYLLSNGVNVGGDLKIRVASPEFITLFD